MATDKIKQDLTIELKFETTQWKKQTSSASKDLDDLNHRFKATAKSTEKATDSTKKFGRALRFIAGLRVAQYMRDSALEIDRVSNRMKFATDSVEGFGEAMEFSANTANDLGLALVPTQRGLATLEASAKGTALAGKEVRELFKGISQASGALSLTADETNSVFLAFSQIISKGKVQAEELRSQIGERIPSAMIIAQRALGVTGAELDKMLQSGTLMAEDLLPKLAKEFQNTFGEQAVKNASSLTAQLNIIGNSAKVIAGYAFNWAEETFRVLEGYNKIAEMIEAGKIEERSSQDFNKQLIKNTEETIRKNDILRKQNKIDDAEFDRRAKKQLSYFSKVFDAGEATEEQLKRRNRLEIAFGGGLLGDKGVGEREIIAIANRYAQAQSKARIAERERAKEAEAQRKKEIADQEKLAKVNGELLVQQAERENQQKQAIDNYEGQKKFLEDAKNFAEELGKKQKKESEQRVKELNAEKKAIKEKINLLKQAQTVDDANQVNFLSSITAGSNKDIRLSIEARTRGLGATAGDVDVAQRNAEELEEQTRLLKNIDEKLDVERA